MIIKKVQINCDCTVTMLLEAMKLMGEDLDTTDMTLIGNVFDPIELHKIADELRIGTVCLLPSNFVDHDAWALCYGDITIWSPGA